MVEIEDDDRLAELCIWANYERKEHGECRVVYIRKADAELLRRSGAEASEESRQGEGGDVRVIDFWYRGYKFRYIYSVSEQAVKAASHVPIAGLPS